MGKMKTQEHNVKNITRFSTYPEIGNIELLHAKYEKQSFDPHFHKGHVIGVIEKGVLGFDYRGKKLVASQGEINIADPGEVHNGFSVSNQGWQYRMFYFSPGQLKQILSEVCDQKSAMPFFKKGVVKDRVFAGELRRLHMDFENRDISLLEKQSRFHLLVASFIVKHANQGRAPVTPGSEPRIISRVKEYIRAHYDNRISLENLSEIAGVSRYYLLRVFAKKTGMTPHSFLNYTRASKARQMIKASVPIIDAALNSGFCDQSHLNRIFKKIYGITPGQYLAGLG